MKKAAPLFSHLKDLLSSQGVQAQISRRPEQIVPLLDLLSIFTCMNAQARVLKNHIEYESEVWIKAFQVSGELGRVTRAWAEAYSQGTIENLVAGISATVERIGKIQRFEIDTLDPVKFRRNAYHTVNVGPDEREFGTVSFDVGTQHVSFHNPLHWLLAGMLKQIGLLKDFDALALQKVLSQLGTSPYGGLGIPGSEIEKSILLLIDYPLRGES